MTEPKSKRGFAAMSPEQRKAIASAGGKTAHSTGRAHKWSSEEAKAAQVKGALKRAENKAKK